MVQLVSFVRIIKAGRSTGNPKIAVRCESSKPVNSTVS